jgi:hypothetical protein
LPCILRECKNFFTPEKGSVLSMSKKPKILVFAGSLRKDSYNKKIAKLAAKDVEAAGAEATYLDLADYPLPIYWDSPPMP